MAAGLPFVFNNNARDYALRNAADVREMISRADPGP